MSLKTLCEEIGREYSRISKLLAEVSKALQAIGLDKKLAPKVLEEIEREEAKYYWRQFSVPKNLEWKVINMEYEGNPRKIHITTHYKYRDPEGKEQEGSEERVYELTSYQGSYEIKRIERQ